MITRFAPSPTGPLHLGHAYSALLAYDTARTQNGTFLLRIEDIDQSRCRPDWEAQICDDLTWLGLRWHSPVLRQSDRSAIYRDAIRQLDHLHLLYHCTCTRADIANALSAPQEGVAPANGPDGPIYPGTCRPYRRDNLTASATLRLDMARAVRNDKTYSFVEAGHGPNGETGLIRFTASDVVTEIGDIVIARHGLGTSYHLSVVIDDAAQGISHVTRGEDLFAATKIHVILQRLLDLPTPIYHHHRLIRDDHGKRLAKRDDARAISRYRAEGATPDDIRRMVGL